MGGGTEAGNGGGRGEMTDFVLILAFCGVVWAFGFSSLVHRPSAITGFKLHGSR